MEKNIRKRGIVNYKGITLIALVVTIVVLLILAGVGIAALTGEEGILTQSSESSILSDIARSRRKCKFNIFRFTL